MKAKDLIKELLKINPESEIIIAEDYYNIPYVSDIYHPRQEDKEGMKYSIGEAGTYDGDPMDL